MIELRGGEHFATEPAARPRILDHLGRDDLQGDDAIHDAVSGLVDAAEAAAAELVEDLVLAEREGGTAAGPDFLHLVSRQPTLLGERRRDLVRRQARRET